MKKIIALLGIGALAFAAACADTPTTALVPDGAAFSHTGPSVQPTSFPGNFVSFDDQQLCYDIFAGSDISGYDLGGFKVNLPAENTNSDIDVTISSNGRYLSWDAGTGVNVLAVVVKGGPNYNLYNYLAALGFPFDHDNNLQSPQNGRNIPAVSHYNFCYYTEGGTQGCTPGYWRNHADRWVGVAPAADFDATFGVDLFDPNVTLGWAIWAQGGGNNAFARHATAALLNAHGGVPNADGTTVDYPYTVALVIQMVQDAVANGTIEATKDLFDTANNLCCPLSGTPAVDVVQ
jgi:hypothetical protein